jgi:ceramide glucosyltransferase
MTIIIIQSIFLLITLSAISYYLFSLYATIKFFQKTNKQETEDYTPPVTILKPLCGLEWESEANLESFCQQKYPEYQIIFACQNPADKIIPLVKQLITKYPEKDLELVINSKVIGANLKVSNLANALEKAKHDILVIADSDIRVTPEYLSTIVQPLQKEEIGVVTCLYKSQTQGFLAKLEAIDIATHFTPRILTAQQLNEIDFAFGSTTVIKRKVLAEIGGFDVIANYLADDYQLGKQPKDRGYQVVLSPYIVTHFLAQTTWRDLLARQNRWFKCIKVSRYWGYMGLIFTQGTVFSLLYYLFTLSNLGLLILSITVLVRILTGYIIGVIYLQDKNIKHYFFLIIIWDLISFGLWFSSIFGNQIEWRGQKMKLEKNGQLSSI